MRWGFPRTLLGTRTIGCGRISSITARRILSWSSSRGTDWANYTRDYPAGSYFVYIRSSGDGPFSMYLDQVVSGAGTVNQVTKRLGQFGGFGKHRLHHLRLGAVDG